MTEHKKLQFLRVVFKALFVVGVIAALTLGYYQIKGLKARMTTAENRLNEGTFYYDDTAKSSESQQPVYKITGTKDVNVKVEQYTGMDTTYVSKPTKAYTLEVENVTKNSVDIDSYSIRARTDQGQLVSPTNIDPKDPTYIQQPISLAPGGKVSFTLYYLPVNGQSFTGLYDSITQKEIK
jgi:hypothetical protein